MPFFKHGGHRLAYTEFGEGPRTCVLVHGLLLSQKMHKPLARSLAERGNRVITLDLLGHGRSARPREMWRYSMSTFGEQVVGLLDHLDADEAVIAGTSLGANTALEVLSLAPDRVRGAVIEMPVLDNALLGCALAFTPLMVGLTFGEPVARAIGAVARAIPTRRGPFWADVVLDTVRQDPAPSAAVLHGLFFGRVAPHRNERRTFQAPTLVQRLGHARRRDAQRAAARGRLDHRAADEPCAPHRRDRRLPRRVLEAAAQERTPPRLAPRRLSLRR